MGVSFWVRRFLVVFAGAGAIICAAQFLKGHGLRYSVLQGLIWGAISSAIVVAAGLYRVRAGRQCAACGDLPATSNPGPRANQPE
jgi:hypothetical protein